MVLATPHTLQVLRRQAGAQDAHGNPTTSYADPIDWPVTYVAPKASEPSGAHRQLTQTDIEVAAPKTDQAPGPADRVVVGESVCEVISVEDFTTGPFEHPSTGLRYQLRRMEG